MSPTASDSSPCPATTPEENSARRALLRSLATVVRWRRGGMAGRFARRQAREARARAVDDLVVITFGWPFPGGGRERRYLERRGQSSIVASMVRRRQVFSQLAYGTGVDQIHRADGHQRAATTRCQSHLSALTGRYGWSRLAGQHENPTGYHQPRAPGRARPRIVWISRVPRYILRSWRSVT